MYELILSNFAMHIALAPEEQEQALSLLQHKVITKRTNLLLSGDIDRNIYFATKGCLRKFHMDKDGQEHTICFTRRTGGPVIL